MCGRSGRAPAATLRRRASKRSGTLVAAAVQGVRRRAGGSPNRVHGSRPVGDAHRRAAGSRSAAARRRGRAAAPRRVAAARASSARTVAVTKAPPNAARSADSSPSISAISRSASSKRPSAMACPGEQGPGLDPVVGRLERSRTGMRRPSVRGRLGPLAELGVEAADERVHHGAGPRAVGVLDEGQSAGRPRRGRARGRRRSPGSAPTRAGPAPPTPGRSRARRRSRSSRAQVGLRVARVLGAAAPPPAPGARGSVAWSP